jgi:hypothetical protein
MTKGTRSLANPNFMECDPNCKTSTLLAFPSSLLMKSALAWIVLIVFYIAYLSLFGSFIQQQQKQILYF